MCFSKDTEKAPKKKYDAINIDSIKILEIILKMHLNFAIKISQTANSINH